MPCHQIMRIGTANVVYVYYCSALRTFKISFLFCNIQLLLAIIPFLSPVQANPCTCHLTSLSPVPSPPFPPVTRWHYLFIHILWD